MIPTAALVVVDLQEITLGNCRTMPADQLLSGVATLIGGFRSSGSPVIHVATDGTPPGRTAYGEGTRLWPADQLAFAQGVGPLAAEPVVRRAAWSGFAHTPLADLLHEREVDTVVIVGLATSFGIESTARSAYDLGFSVVVPVDAVAGPDPAGHDWTLSRVIPALGVTTTVADLLA